MSLKDFKCLFEMPDRENHLSHRFTIFNTAQSIGIDYALVMNTWCLDVLRISCATGFARLTASC